MLLFTNREKEMMDAIISIGNRNVSLQEIAKSLNISYLYLLHKRCEMAAKNGYHTFSGLMCDYVAEKTRSEIKDNPLA